MRLRNAILAGLMFGMAHGVSVNAGEEKITKGYNSMDAMGCMLVRECTKDVEEVYSLLDISANYPNTEEFTPVAQDRRVERTLEEVRTEVSVLCMGAFVNACRDNRLPSRNSPTPTRVAQ